MKQKQCKAEGCEVMYTPRNMQHKTCGYECAKAYAKAVIKKRKEKVARRDLKEFNQNDRQFLTKAAQKVVNQYVRLRDRNEGCCTCGTKTGKFDSGHWLSAGGHGSVRFNTLNIHKQCYRDNRMRSGDIRVYREFMVNKYGIEKVEWLESESAKPRKYDVEYLKKLIMVFKKKIKLYESRL